ncbi:MAG: ATP-binding protein [Methylococcales bacterium]
MLTDQELCSLLTDLESDRIERTTSTTNTAKFSETVCAFANDFPNHRQPGYLLLGVNDDGTLSGLEVTDQWLQNLGALRSDGNILPLPAISVSKKTLPQGDVAIVEVLPSDLPPLRYKGRIWIRIGPRKAIANEQEERILSERRVSLAKTFDAQPCIGSTLNDLALDLFQVGYRNAALAPEIIEENNRELTDQLSSLRFYEPGKRCPTNAGILLFGKNPLHWLPGAYIQFVRFEGGNLSSDPISEKELSGDLLNLLRELESLIDIQVQSSVVPDSTLREGKIWDYPPIALRELLMNAVMHRDYASNAAIRFYWFADRVEIQSPGGLYGACLPENFPRQNDYRNPILAEAMKSLGYVNKYGRGVLRAREALAKNGSPAAEFDFDHGYVLATIRSRN